MSDRKYRPVAEKKADEARSEHARNWKRSRKKPYAVEIRYTEEYLQRWPWMRGRKNNWWTVTRCETLIAARQSWAAHMRCGYNEVRVMLNGKPYPIVSASPNPEEQK